MASMELSIDIEAPKSSKYTVVSSWMLLASLCLHI
jgi:hypothetical protein